MADNTSKTHQKHRTWQWNFTPGFFLLCFFFVVLFCFLSHWQVQRYHFKENLIATYNARLHEAPESLQTVSQGTDIQFKRVQVTGTYLNNETMFIQNRFHDENLGFEVLTPFKIVGDDTVILIDRGWIQKPEGNALPTIAAVEGQQKVVGSVKLVNEYQFILGQNILEPQKKPLVMQKVDIKEIEKLTGQGFYPFVLRLDPHAKNGFVRDWNVDGLNPERHLGYAVQWALMAIALTIAYLCFSIKRTREL